MKWTFLLNHILAARPIGKFTAAIVIIQSVFAAINGVAQSELLLLVTGAACGFLFADQCLKS